MKKSSASVTARATLSALFIVIGILLCVLALFTPRSRSANPPSNPASPGFRPTDAPLAWNGTATPGTPPAANGESTCVEGTNCDTFTLNVGGTQADWAAAGKRIEVRISYENAK